MELRDVVKIKMIKTSIKNPKTEYTLFAHMLFNIYKSSIKNAPNGNTPAITVAGTN